MNFDCFGHKNDIEITFTVTILNGTHPTMSPASPKSPKLTQSIYLGQCIVYIGSL